MLTNCITNLKRIDMNWIKFNKETDEIPKCCLWVFGINGVEYIEDGQLNNRNYFTYYMIIKKPLPPN